MIGAAMESASANDDDLSYAVLKDSSRNIGV
jgi:hypothetical protein